MSTAPGGPAVEPWWAGAVKGCSDGGQCVWDYSVSLPPGSSELNLPLFFASVTLQREHRGLA